jgi:hypothetical protein
VTADEDVEFGLGILSEAPLFPAPPRPPRLPAAAQPRLQDLGPPEDGREPDPAVAPSESPDDGAPPGPPEDPDAGAAEDGPGLGGPPGPGGEGPEPDPLEGAPDVDPLEAMQAQLRRDRLYDNFDEIEGSCRELYTAADTVSERGKDDAAREVGRQVKEIMAEAERQCGLVRRNLDALGDENAGAVFASVRERLEAASAALKHVIDADENFSADKFGIPTRSEEATK